MYKKLQIDVEYDDASKHYLTIVTVWKFTSKRQGLIHNLQLDLKMGKRENKGIINHIKFIVKIYY